MDSIRISTSSFPNIKNKTPNQETLKTPVRNRKLKDIVQIWILKWYKTSKENMQKINQWFSLFSQKIWTNFYSRKWRIKREPNKSLPLRRPSKKWGNWRKVLIFQPHTESWLWKVSSPNLILLLTISWLTKNSERCKRNGNKESLL